jgi:hypothetical protein
MGLLIALQRCRAGSGGEIIFRLHLGPSTTFVRPQPKQATRSRRMTTNWCGWASEPKRKKRAGGTVLARPGVEIRRPELSPFTAVQNDANSTYDSVPNMHPAAIATDRNAEEDILPIPFCAFSAAIAIPARFPDYHPTFCSARHGLLSQDPYQSRIPVLNMFILTALGLSPDSKS